MWSLGCGGDPHFEENRRYLGALVVPGQPVPVYIAALPAASLSFQTPDLMEPLRATKV